jgi:hypothetical protein
MDMRYIIQHQQSVGKTKYREDLVTLTDTFLIPGHELNLQGLRLWLAIGQSHDTQVLQIYVSQRCLISYLQGMGPSGGAQVHAVVEIEPCEI